jgi:hypothetical protein
MKTLTPTWSILIVSTIIFISCEEENIVEQSNRITVQFETAKSTIAENAETQNVTVSFNKPLPADAELRLKVDNTFTENFETSSSVENGLIKIQAAKGANKAVLQLNPVDNAQKEGDRVAKLQIQDLSIPFRTGTNPGLDITITDDESTNTTYSLANFVEQSVTLEETTTTAIEYQVHFSEAVAFDSEIKITLHSDKGAYGLNYVSEPLAEDNILTLAVAAGSRVVSFHVRAIDNQKISGDVSVELSIHETSGSIRKGNKLQQALTIKDDELRGKPRGYEVTAGSTVLKKFVEYNEDGRVTRAHWESYNPYNRQWTETYHYDGNGNIQRVEKYPGAEVRYYWNNSRITRSESFRNNVQHNYTEYDYDDLGNLAGAAPYYRQNDGTFVKGLYTIYFYYLDGNLYKSLTFQDSNDPENPTLVSTRTYENYIDVENPFPMTEVLPNINMQRTLPTTYRIEESGTDFTYHMTYEFGEDGRPEKRIATSSNDTQTAVYHYY